MPFVALQSLHQLHDGYRKAIRITVLDLLLLQENGKTQLIKYKCPHADASLTYATFSNNSLRCPVHGIAFDLVSGRSRSPACAQGLQFIPLVYDGNRIGIELN